MYSAANDPRPQIIPRPEMIPNLDHKWPRTANDSRCRPPMMPLENKEWHGFVSWVEISLFNINRTLHTGNLNRSIRFLQAGTTLLFWSHKVFTQKSLQFPKTYQVVQMQSLSFSTAHTERDWSSIYTDICFRKACLNYALSYNFEILKE